jgi:hypothetical protein
LWSKPQKDSEQLQIAIHNPMISHPSIPIFPKMW